MATYTEKYKLKKPDTTDFVDVKDFNDNFDIIDTQLAGKLDKSGGTVTGKLGAGSLSIGDVTFTQTDFTGEKEIAIGDSIVTGGISVVGQTPGDEGGDYDELYITNNHITLSTASGFTKRIFADDTDEILHIDSGTENTPCVLRGVDTPINANDAANKAYVDSKAAISVPKKVYLDWYWDGAPGGQWQKDSAGHPYMIFPINGVNPNNDNQTIQLSLNCAYDTNLSAVIDCGFAITAIATNSITITALNVNYDELEAEDPIFDTDTDSILTIYVYNY